MGPGLAREVTAWRPSSAFIAAEEGVILHDDLVGGYHV